MAPRVSGQVSRVLVDDNMRVKKGDLLVQLDKEPFQVQVASSERPSVARGRPGGAESKARGLEALAGSQRWKLQTAIEQVDEPGRPAEGPGGHPADAGRRPSTGPRPTSSAAEQLLGSGGISQEEFDQRQQADAGGRGRGQAGAGGGLTRSRVSLGLAPQPEKGKT